MPCFSHTQLPYCLQKTTDGKWLALNRRYKPIGTTNLDWVDYNTHPNRLKIDEKVIGEITQLAPCAHPDMPDEPGIIYLFAGDPTPFTSDLDWARYTKLLKLVAAASTDK